jgi:glutathione S-transferase
VVPTLVDRDRVLIESTLINEYLEDAYPELPLRPADPAGRHAMRLWTKRIDDKVHPMAGVITFGIGARPLLLRRAPEDIEANIEAIPDPRRRAIRRSVIENGVKAPEMRGAIEAFVRFLDDMEQSLGEGPWLAGETLSLADAAAMPYVVRLDHLAMNALLAKDARPRVADWYARLQARPSFESAVRAWLPEPMVEMFRNNGREVWPDVEPLTRLASES